MDNFKFDNFTNTNPNLINYTTNDKLVKLISINTKTSFLDNFKKFINDNITLIILLLIIVIVIYWRYKYVQKHKVEKFLYDEGIERDDNGNLIYTYDEMGNIIARSTFNPNIPLNKQNSYVRYLPDEFVKGASADRLNGVNYINTSNINNDYDVIEDGYENTPRVVHKGPYYKNANPQAINSDDNNEYFRKANHNNLVNYANLF